MLSDALLVFDEILESAKKGFVVEERNGKIYLEGTDIEVIPGKKSLIVAGDSTFTLRKKVGEWLTEAKINSKLFSFSVKNEEDVSYSTLFLYLENPGTQNEDFSCISIRGKDQRLKEGFPLATGFLIELKRLFKEEVVGYGSVLGRVLHEIRIRDEINEPSVDWEIIGELEGARKIIFDAYNAVGTKKISPVGIVAGEGSGEVLKIIEALSSMDYLKSKYGQIVVHTLGGKTSVFVKCFLSVLDGGSIVVGRTNLGDGVVEVASTVARLMALLPVRAETMALLREISRLATDSAVEDCDLVFTFDSEKNEVKVNVYDPTLEEDYYVTVEGLFDIKISVRLRNYRESTLRSLAVVVGRNGNFEVKKDTLTREIRLREYDILEETLRFVGNSLPLGGIPPIDLADIFRETLPSVISDFTGIRSIHASSTLPDLTVRYPVEDGPILGGALRN